MSHSIVVKGHSLAVLVHGRYTSQHAHAAFMAVLGTVYVQVCGLKVPHDGLGLWQTYKHVLLHCLALVLEQTHQVCEQVCLRYHVITIGLWGSCEQAGCSSHRVTLKHGRSVHSHYQALTW